MKNYHCFSAMKLCISLIIVVACFAVACKSDKVEPPPSNPTPPSTSWAFETTPVWVDEFDSGSTPNSNKWTYEVGSNGWGNSELEYYTNGENATLDNGILHIIAKHDFTLGGLYTSARMVTRGRGDWLYGRFEIRARLPKGIGTWPAIWMMPTESAYGPWPNSGEIDIMEHVGFDQNNIHFTIHNNNNTFNGAPPSEANIMINSATDSFHVYRCDWTPKGIRGFVDDQQYFEFTNNNAGYIY